ncbi:MAG: hypothetical protein J6R38_00230 [Alistipes sp.]|nr:hypothetical protein [Alistipes sp.]
MKKFLLVAACFALTLSSCIKDGASEAVNSIYEATAEKIKAEARLLDAEAAALKLLSEAEAALKAADAAAKEIQNQILDVERQLKEVELEAAKAELELLLAELESQKAEIAADMEAAALAAEKALIEAELALMEAQAAYAATLEGLEAAKAAKLVLLYNNYAELTADLLAAKADLSLTLMDLASAEQDLVDVEAAKEVEIAEADEVIATMNTLIANEEAKIEVVKKYQTVTLAEAQAAYDAADLEKFELGKAFEKAANAYNALAEEFDTMDPDAQPLVEYLMSDPLGLQSRIGDSLLPVVDYLYDENGVFWYGFYVEDEDPYTNTSDPESWEFPMGWTFVPAYSYWGTTYDMSGDYPVLVSLEQYNPEAFELYLSAYVGGDAAYYQDAIASMTEELAMFESLIDPLKGLADAAKVMADAYNNWQFLILDTTTDYIVDEVNYTQTLTTFGRYNKANLAYNGGVDESGWFPVDIEGTQAALAAAEAALKAAKAAVEDAEDAEAKAAAEEELKWAQKYYDLAEAADKAAEAEYDAAVEALDAQKKLIAPAEQAFYAARNEYEYYYASNESSLSNVVNAIFVETGGSQVYPEYDGYDSIDYNASYEYILMSISSLYDYIAYYEYQIEEYEFYLNTYMNVEAMVAEIEAKLAEYQPEADKFIEEFNALSKAVYEAELEFVAAAEAYDAKVAEVDALLAVIAGADAVAEELETYYANIEGYKQTIAEFEAIKANLYNVTNAEELVEVLNTLVELAEAKVATYELLVANAKDAWEAACEE